jgi:hypothetical protein
MLFGTIQQGYVYTWADEEMDENKREDLLAKKRDNIAKNGLETLVSGTGVPGKVVLALKKGIEDYALTPEGKKNKDGVDIALGMLESFSPIISVRTGLIKGMYYDAKDIEKDYDGIKPYLRLSTKAYALLTNQGIPKEIIERMDDAEFIMAVRTTFWQAIGDILGQSPYSLDPDYYKNKKKEQKKTDKGEKIINKGGYQTIGVSGGSEEKITIGAN